VQGIRRLVRRYHLPVIWVLRVPRGATDRTQIPPLRQPCFHFITRLHTHASFSLRAFYAEVERKPPVPGLLLADDAAIQRAQDAKLFLLAQPFAPMQRLVCVVSHLFWLLAVSPLQPTEPIAAAALFAQLSFAR
jgi:hypothetical protein